ncbi:MAG TPA: hypothetical protein VF587_08840, partial [Solirubrobacteraceae bacterium]
GRYQVEYPMRHLLRSGPPAGPLAAGPPCDAGAVSVGGGATACDSSPEAVVFEADGTVRRYERASGSSSPGIDLAGDLVALNTRLQAGTGVRVLRRDTGEELLRVEEDVRDFALAPDGTLAYLLTDGTAAWSRPDRSEVHRLPATRDSVDVAVAGERIALQSVTYPNRNGWRQLDSVFTVVDLEGRLVARHAANATVGGFDFDGGRLAYGRLPCRHTAVHVWEVDRPAADELGPAGCAVPVPSTRRLRLGRDGLVRVPFGCAPGESAECVATVWLTLRWRGRDGEVHWRRESPDGVALDPGERVTLAFRPRRREVRRAVRARINVMMAPLFDGSAYLKHVLPIALRRGS